MDDLSAVKAIVETLQSFERIDQERIVRWSLEKLGLGALPGPSSVAIGSPSPSLPSSFLPTDSNRVARGLDIKSFITQKNPSSDNQFAATVAYYFAFESPEDQRKESIDSGDLQEACRKAGRARLGDPGKTLRNAHGMGYLDKAERGSFRINTVGENLVAMALPSSSGDISSRVTRHVSRKKAVAKKTKGAGRKK